MDDKRFEELFDDLVSQHYDEFSEAIFVPQADYGIGALLLEVDTRLFNSKFKKELEAEHFAMTAWQADEAAWMERGR